MKATSIFSLTSQGFSIIARDVRRARLLRWPRDLQVRVALGCVGLRDFGAVCGFGNVVEVQTFSASIHS